MAGLFKIQISPERAAQVIEEISIGSEPKARFYTMVAASTGIAAFGLIQDSTAVVIGAMLVAPLMTPIFGITLSLIRGDALLLGRSLRAEILGVLLTIALAFFFGYLIPGLQATPEMIIRTKPNLLDLLVAVFAGFAGAYAMVDEDISPALPGVAIATAIVPPLANTGLCLALGAYYGALGSFLLFFANFLSILLVAAAVFIAGGMALEIGSIKAKDIARKFGLAALGFLLIGAFLSKSLYDITQSRRLRASITRVLSEELSHLPATELRKLVYQKYKGKLYVLAHVHASGDIAPSDVKTMQAALEKVLQLPTELFVRRTLSQDVSSTGSINQVLTETLDGFFIGLKTDPRISLQRSAEQAIREFMETKPALYLESVSLLPFGKHELLLATVFGLEALSSKEVGTLESDIRDRTGSHSIYLAIRHINADVYDRYGYAYYEWTTFADLTPAQEELMDRVTAYLERHFETGDFALVNSDITWRQDTYHVLVELTGPKLYSEAERAALSRELAELAGEPLKLYVRSVPELVLTEDGTTSFRQLQKNFSDQMKVEYRKELDRIRKQGL